MMDASLTTLASFASRLQFDDLAADVVHDCKRRIIDTLACGFSALKAKPFLIARALALRADVPRGAAVIGTDRRVLPELAAFANGVAMRYADGNDSYPGGGGHPSDALPAVLAAADLAGASGRTVIAATVAAYEIYAALFRAVALRERGLDHVFYTAVAGAAGASRALGLDETATAHAVALAATPNFALEVTRRGTLSEWKGCAGPNAARNAVFAALLAAEGLTGPERAIEGEHGVWDLLGRFTLPALGGAAGPSRIRESNLKPYLAEYHAQAPITAALALSRAVKAEDIERVTLHTYHFAWSEAGREPEKWRPTTRETADHSLPYIVAAVLLDGAFSEDIFEPHRLGDERIHALAARIAVEADPELTSRFPKFVPCRLEILTRNGERRSESVDYPPGHFRNPMSDEQVAAKFRELAGRELHGPQADTALERLWRLDGCTDLTTIWTSLKAKEEQ